MLCCDATVSGGAALVRLSRGMIVLIQQIQLPRAVFSRSEVNGRTGNFNVLKAGCPSDKVLTDQRSREITL